MIHYIAIWGENTLGRKLSYSPAGLKKAKYVVDVLSRFEKTKIVSFASGGKEWDGFYKNKLVPWVNNIDIEYCFTFGSSYKLLRLLERILNIVQLLIYLLKVPKTDIVVIYHERYFRHAIKLVKLVSSVKIILEIEEVYTLAGMYPKRMIEAEIQSMKYADAYILVNDIIKDEINLPSNRPYCVSYGAYKLNNSCSSFVKDGKIHIVYAGILDKIKRGAEMAIMSCQYLPNNYCMHIAGFGAENDVQYILGLIEEYKNKSSCEIIYEGYLSGDSYDKLIYKCSIGLSTQVSSELSYSDTSFPSKIVNYLSYGLTVVSTRIRVLESSRVSDLLSFYSEDNPYAIADAIIKCPLVSKSVAQRRIEELDEKFTDDLKNIIYNLK